MVERVFCPSHFVLWEKNSTGLWPASSKSTRISAHAVRRGRHEGANFGIAHVFLFFSVSQVLFGLTVVVWQLWQLMDSQRVYCRHCRLNIQHVRNIDREQRYKHSYYVLERWGFFFYFYFSRNCETHCVQLQSRIQHWHKMYTAVNTPLSFCHSSFNLWIEKYILKAKHKKSSKLLL